jgi:uncharacterized protein (TIGR02300 family)
MVEAALFRMRDDSIDISFEACSQCRHVTAVTIRSTPSSKDLPVAKPELGIKRQCASCGVKFYDLMKNPIVCPKCSTVLSPPVATVGRTRRVVEEASHEGIVTAPALKPESDESDSGGDDVEIETNENEKADDAILIEPDDDETDVDDLLGDSKGKDD